MVFLEDLNSNLEECSLTEINISSVEKTVLSFVLNKLLEPIVL